MRDTRRLVVATIFGFLMGVVCYLGGRFGLKDEIGTAALVYILVNRTLIGFVIGISPIRMRWPVHGAFMGILVGLPFAVGCLLEPDNVETAIAALILGGIYGFLIELFTSVVFGARPTRSARQPA
jgi:hypothetical protein